MNIVERARAFVQGLRELAGRAAWEWRRCPRCGESLTCKNGSYRRHPWFFEGRRAVRVQRHWCHGCRRSYSERSALLVRGSWYAREVHRCAIDHWQHVGSSVRRTAEWLRSWLGRQERWLLWRPLGEPPAERERCRLSASTVDRWLDRAGRAAERTVAGQLAGLPGSGQLATDGLWAKLRGGAKRVVLLLVDSVSGLAWPPVVVADEATAPRWGRLFDRARAAGLDLDTLCGVTSDGARGLSAYLNQALEGVGHQRCVFHLWRTLGEAMAAAARAAADGLAGEAAELARQQTRAEPARLLHGVLDATTAAAARTALAQVAAHPRGSGLARAAGEHPEAALLHLKRSNRGLLRVAPEWCWRDFRLRLGHARNHRSDERLERAALVWATYRNFTPAQERYERKRRYRHPGQCPLTVAGVPPGPCSYLDALAV